MSYTILTSGNDSHSSGTGNQWVLGGGGNDTLTSTAGNDTFDGAAGDDSLIGGVGDVVYGGTGHDTLSSATMEGGAGNDTYILKGELIGLAGNASTVKEAAGGGIDTVLVDIKTMNWVQLDYTLAAHVENFDIIHGYAGTSRTHIIGNALDNVIKGGTNQSNHLQGLDGNDRLVGSSLKADTLDGGNGNDTLFGSGEDLLLGGFGHDRLESRGADTVRGGAGNDTYVVTGQAMILETFGEGNDTVLTNNAYWKLGTEIENLIYNEGTPATGFHFEGNSKSNVIATSSFNDRLVGWGGADTMNSGDGNDTVDAGDSDDSVLAGAGADSVVGGKGDDELKGEAGNDSISADTGDDMVWGGDGADWLSAGDGFDLVLGEGGADKLYGGSGNDSLDGGAEGDTMAGDAGADTLDGGDGADRLSGGADGDVLMGRAGNDYFAGGAGMDTLMGGEGADIFAYSSVQQSAKGAADRIIDYAAGVDRIDLSFIDADGAFGSGNAFRFNAERPVFTTAGDLWIDQDYATWVRGDTNGDGAADLEIRLDGLQNLTAADFIL